jgi:hypothetical protein
MDNAPAGRMAGANSLRNNRPPRVFQCGKEITMIGKIVGAIAGKRAAQHVRGLNGPGGALLGAGAASVIRRLGPMGLAVAAAGGYALKRRHDKQQRAHPLNRTR